MQKGSKKHQGEHLFGAPPVSVANHFRRRHVPRHTNPRTVLLPTDPVAKHSCELYSPVLR